MKPVTLRRNDFRFEPLTLGFELQSGGARFDNTFDAWDNRFICIIRNPAQHIVLESRYLARNPYSPVRRGVTDAADSGQVQIQRTSPPEIVACVKRLACNGRSHDSGSLRFPQGDRDTSLPLRALPLTPGRLIQSLITTLCLWAKWRGMLYCVTT